MSIILVRHGETAGNAGAVIQKPDVPLNERGLAQAALVAERLATLGYVHILCSDLLRARMTADALRAQSGIALEESPLLQERNFGDLRGTPYSELKTDPFVHDYLPPNGEDGPMFHARVARAFDLIVARRRELPGTLVVVTHGLVCRAMVERHVPGPWSSQNGPVQLPVTEVPRAFHNTSVTIIGHAAPHELALLNCAAHLEGQSAAARLGGVA
jgi:2,3-bisphosphoglycerate-dependent phosphoglycerate mutase